MQMVGSLCGVLRLKDPSRCGKPTREPSWAPEPGELTKSSRGWLSLLSSVQPLCSRVFLFNKCSESASLSVCFNLESNTFSALWTSRVSPLLSSPDITLFKLTTENGDFTSHQRHNEFLTNSESVMGKTTSSLYGNSLKRMKLP